VAQRWGTVPGVVLCAAAAGVKSPAALGVLFLGWVWAGPGASTRRRLGHSVGAGLIALCTLEAISAVSGTGWGWLRTSTAADQSFTFVTPIDALSRAVSEAARVVDLHISALGARTVFSVVGLICAAIIALRLLLRSTNSTMLRNLGLTLLVVALLGPILWGWYVTWGVLVLAPAASGTLRRIVIAISTVEALVAASSVKGIIGGILTAGIFPDLVLVAALLAIAIAPLGQFSRMFARRTATQRQVDRPLSNLPA
jgi:hypothetical protein